MKRIVKDRVSGAKMVPRNRYDKKFHLKLYALANILGIENYVNKVKYSDEDKDNVKYSNIRCAIHGVE